MLLVSSQRGLEQLARLPHISSPDLQCGPGLQTDLCHARACTALPAAEGRPAQAPSKTAQVLPQALSPKQVQRLRQH